MDEVTKTETTKINETLNASDKLNTADTPKSPERRQFLSGSALLAAGATVGATMGASLGMPAVARAQAARPRDERVFAFSTPFSGQDSFSGQIGGLNKGIEDFGGELTTADASFDLRRQNDQIGALAASNPDALIILPVDPVGVSNAVAAAVASGVPVFLMDSYVPGATAAMVGMHNNFGMGLITTDYMIGRLGGSGKIAAMELPINEAWNMRDMAFEYRLRQFPEIEVVAKWAFDPTGSVTPRAAADSFLTAHPDLDAIWCSWDNAAMEASLAAIAAGRPEIFTTGIDGGPAAFEVLRSGGPFSFTAAQSFFSQAYDMIYYAHEHLDGNNVPRMMINPVYGVDHEMLESAGELADTYDQAGVPEQLGWKRTL